MQTTEAYVVYIALSLLPKLLVMALLVAREYGEAATSFKSFILPSYFIRMTTNS
jgi:hypothetical protein